MGEEMLERRLMLAVAAALLWGAMGGAASADSLVWTVRSEFRYKVQIKFFSQDRNHVWPNANEAYDLNDYGTHTYNLRCRSGEKICFGAWVTGNANRYWGGGYNNAHACSRCCFTCGGGPTVPQVLNP